MCIFFYYNGSHTRTLSCIVDVFTNIQFHIVIYTIFQINTQKSLTFVNIKTWLYQFYLALLKLTLKMDKYWVYSHFYSRIYDIWHENEMIWYDMKNTQVFIHCSAVEYLFNYTKTYTKTSIYWYLFSLIIYPKNRLSINMIFEQTCD